MRLEADCEYGALQALRESCSAEATCECPQEFEVLRGPRGSFRSRSRHGNSVVESVGLYPEPPGIRAPFPLAVRKSRVGNISLGENDGARYQRACTALKRCSVDPTLRCRRRRTMRRGTTSRTGAARLALFERDKEPQGFGRPTAKAPRPVRPRTLGNVTPGLQRSQA